MQIDFERIKKNMLANCQGKCIVDIINWDQVLECDFWNRSFEIGLIMKLL